MSDAAFKAAVEQARRKEELLAQGVLLRAELTLAKTAVKAHLRPDSLAQSIFSQVVKTAFSLARNRSSFMGAAGMPRALPMVLSGLAMLARKGWLRPVLKIGLVLGGIGAVAALVWRGKQVAASRRLIH